MSLNLELNLTYFVVVVFNFKAPGLNCFKFFPLQLKEISQLHGTSRGIKRQGKKNCVLVRILKQG